MKIVRLFIVWAIIGLAVVGCDTQSTINDNQVAEAVNDTTKRDASIVEGKPEETNETEVYVADENKLIDDEGCLYEVNTNYSFPNSELTVKRVKLRRDYYGYYMFFDFDVNNMSDKEISWRIQYNDNVIGFINAGELQNEKIGGNNNYDDKDFSGNRISNSTYSLKPNESYSCYKLGLFNDYTKSILELVDIKEKDIITITLYFKENDVKYPFEIKLNQ